MRCVKDKAGNPLARVTQIRERTNDKLAVFSGNCVRTMIDEMRLGFSRHRSEMSPPTISERSEFGR